MVAFHTGLFSWWAQTADGVQQVATVFKKIFSPPRAENLQTLAEKTCLAYLVENVLFRMFEGLQLSMSHVSVFYRAWDVHRVVLTSYDDVSFSGQAGQDSRILQFKNYIRVKKLQYSKKQRQLEV